MFILGMPDTWLSEGRLQLDTVRGKQEMWYNLHCDIPTESLRCSSWYRVGIFQLIGTVLEQEVLCKARESTQGFAKLWWKQNYAFCFSLLVKALKTGKMNAERIKRRGCEVPKTCLTSLSKGFMGPNLGDREEKQEESIQEIK